MKPKFFFPLVIALYLAAPYLFYRYMSFNEAREDTIKLESGIVSNPAQVNAEQVNESDILNRQEDDLTLQSYGYLGGGVFAVLCPTLLLLFRHRLLT